ncbi:SIS domain-containing protein [Desulforhopalus sp. IMCC35007]|uniref:SIS domain-containing protein n=1 Tax=Desulforhopalus sp. IMCC35007 TaxID=2569543 RepID=UPI0010AE8D09|nr:SIS domain-containing protein [Desulforhopalus sp. IMCC35007]TKB06895.1 SIS domain-containing protein [Desulforhopalus sp. IMCC35007]
MSEDLLKKITELIGELNPSEMKVARCVLSRPTEVVSQSIASLAAASRVSEPTVMRFCRSIGCKGYQDFKLELAVALAGNTPYVHTSITQKDTTSQMAEKICHYSSNSLRVLAESLDMDALERAIHILNNAGRIEIYGSGASGIVALDAQHKLFRTKVPTVAYRDSHLQMMSASSLDENCVALAFSYTGRSLNIIEAAKLARQRGAVVVGVTDKDSPLAEYCDPVINNPNIEDTVLFSPMVSRICQLAIVDILATGIAMEKGLAAWEHLKKIKESVRSFRPTGCDNKSII